MTKVYVGSVDAPVPAAQATVKQQHALFIRLALKSIRTKIVDNPEEADLIFAYVSFPFYFGGLDPSRRCVRQHPLRRRFPERFFVYDPEDYSVPFAPGIYTSIHRRWYNPSRQRPGPYIQYLDDHPDLIEYKRPVETAELLFSFSGDARTHRVRTEVMRLEHSRCHLHGDKRYAAAHGRWAEYRREYAQLIHSSKFVLCPRGRGTSSIRLFEVMRAGRVPVVIADDWVAPAGPNWSECSIRVPESLVDRIPRILEEHESEAEELATRARQEWLTWFADDVVFDCMVSDCLALKDDIATNRSFVRSPWFEWTVRHRIWKSVPARVGRMFGALAVTRTS